ncbi:hypothetical protein [Streptomyces griseosporeus]|uniref:hypothetical protein n=1 Tax=Streptomyces griseosporeus TaxID=1910 RepID=UPI00167C4ED7|nr:hypothetical protein [Streptomyces griseosporeus]GHF91986.1 hypothetical protein GCM10018783_73490 [Streptomyces griseosporeus]
MVTIPFSTGFSVDVNVVRENGEMIVLADYDSTIATDAFDYAIQALGYFRFAIQSMDARKIQIIVRLGNQIIQVTEIAKEVPEDGGFVETV